MMSGLNKRCFLAACILSVGWVIGAYGEIVIPSDDAFVINTSADESFPTEERILTWTAYMSGGRGRSYIKFPLTGLPDRSMISEAMLMLYQYDAGGFVPIVDIFHVDDDTWNQSSVTWNNQPSPRPISAELIISKDIGYEVGWVSFDLLNTDVWNYNDDVGDGHVSLLIKSKENGDERHNFYSYDETVEGDYRPYLEITVVPEPTCYGLVTIIGMVILLRRSMS